MRPEPKPLILLVEDEAELATLIANHLEEAGMQTQICSNAGHAARYLKKNFVNLILLDVNLPDQSGFSFFEQIRNEDIATPTIFLTGNDQETSKIQGLEIGGDDYITKPFSYPELTARIRAVLRRAESKTDLNLTKNVSVADQPFDFCGATVNPERLELAFPNGQTIAIGRKELGILAYLNEHQGTVITRKALIHAVWGIHADVRSRSLDQYVVKVREIFKQQGNDLENFRTIHGVGYIFDPKGIAE